MPTDSPLRLIAFYKRLGFTLVKLNPDPTGADEPRSAGLALGDIRINLHGPYLWRQGHGSLAASDALPGCLDICFVWSGTAAAAVAAFEAAGATVIEGPVPRTGGRAVGTGIGDSVYARDPDGNLLELLAYAD
jgi:catechol 2,3-dioxygenase-like lactoylglutathione lyase family enzyme